VTLAVGWLFLGRGIRGWSHLSRHPWEIFLLPLLAVMVVLVALPIKTYALVTMNKQGWLTRTEDQTGGAGQTAATLTPAEAQ
jgi:N-acetylglucosaminyltransferase